MIAANVPGFGDRLMDEEIQKSIVLAVGSGGTGVILWVVGKYLVELLQTWLKARQAAREVEVGTKEREAIAGRQAKQEEAEEGRRAELHTIQVQRGLMVDMQQRIDLLEDRLDKASKRIDAVFEELYKTRSENAQLQASLDAAMEQLKDMRLDNVRLRKGLEHAERFIGALPFAAMAAAGIALPEWKPLVIEGQS